VDGRRLVAAGAVIIEILSCNNASTRCQGVVRCRRLWPLGGPDVAAKIWDTIEAKRSGK
jgi:hypothetical protein